jgi:antitoxin HicB
MRYAVTITADDGQFTVTFPDVPNAITFGETVEEALAHAPDALLTIIDAYMRLGRDIPMPSGRQSAYVIDIPASDAAKIQRYTEARSR